MKIAYLLLLLPYYLLLVKRDLSCAIKTKQNKKAAMQLHINDFTAVFKWSSTALGEPMSQLAGEAPNEDKIVGDCVHSDPSG